MSDVILQREEIITLLEELGEELEQRGLQDPLRIVIFGGVYMLTQVGNRMATYDVDIVPLLGEDPQQATRRQKILKQAINAVASRHHLPRHWMNDDGAPFVDEIIARGELIHWKTFKMLMTYLPEKACMLALKLTAFRPFQDTDDTLALCEQLGISTREEAQKILDLFVPQSWQEETMIPNTLEDLFG